MALKMPMGDDDGDEPKNPFKGLLGGEEPDGDEEGDDGEYPVTPEEIEAAGEVRKAIKSGSDEELAKSICMLVKLHGG